MFSRLFDKLARGQQRKELQLWVDSLRGCEGSELGFVVAQAADYRNELLQGGVDLLKPAYEAARDPSLTFRLSTKVVQLQKQGRQIAAPGLMVWVHTLRAVQVPEIRYLGKEMWGHLSRGFPYAKDAAFQCLQQTGMRLNLEGFHLFPEGLSPISEGA